MTEYYEIKDHVLTLGEEIGVQHAAELYDDLNDYLTVGDSELSIDATSVKKVDTAILQLLVSFVQEFCDEHKATLTWVSPSDSFNHAARTLGLESPLHLH